MHTIFLKIFVDLMPRLNKENISFFLSSFYPHQVNIVVFVPFKHPTDRRKKSQIDIYILTGNYPPPQWLSKECFLAVTFETVDTQESAGVDSPHAKQIYNCFLTQVLKLMTASVCFYIF